MTAIAARHSAWRPSRSEAIPCGDLLSTTVVMSKPPRDRGSANDTALVSIWLCTRRPTFFCRYLSHERRTRRSHGTGAREPDDARNDRQCGLRAAASGCSTHDEGAVIGRGHMSVRNCPLALPLVTPLSRLMFTDRPIPFSDGQPSWRCCDGSEPVAASSPSLDAATHFRIDQASRPGAMGLQDRGSGGPVGSEARRCDEPTRLSVRYRPGPLRRLALDIRPHRSSRCHQHAVGSADISLVQRSTAGAFHVILTELSVLS